MDDRERPNRQSNMEKAEGDRDEAIDQEQMIERRPHPQDPTRVEHQRTSDATTISNGGLAGGRPEGGARKTPEREKTEDKPTLRTDM